MDLQKKKCRSKKTERVSVRLESELTEFIQELAERKRVAAGQVIRQLLWEARDRTSGGLVP